MGRTPNSHHTRQPSNMPRRRYVPINERVQDLCYDFLPENGHAVQTGLPEDSKDIYNAFQGDDKKFFENGRNMFFSGQMNPQSFFGQAMNDADSEVHETIEVLPDGRKVKKRTRVSYEELEQPKMIEQKTSSSVNAAKREPMTPIEIMFATQMAMRDVFDRSKTTRRKADITGMDIDRLAAEAGVETDPALIAARKAKEQNSPPPVSYPDYSNAPERDVGIKVLRD